MYLKQKCFVTINKFIHSIAPLQNVEFVCVTVSSPPLNYLKKILEVFLDQSFVLSPFQLNLYDAVTPFLCSPAVGLTAAAAAAAAATNAAIAEAMKVKKIKLEVMSSYHGSNTQHGADFENGDLSSSVGESPSTSSMTHTACRPGISKRLAIRHKWSGKTHCSLHLGVTYFSNVSSVTPCDQILRGGSHLLYAINHFSDIYY